MRITGLLLCLATASSAQVLPPQAFDLQSESQNASLTMNCEGDRPYRTMTCQFLSVSLDKPGTDALAADVEKLRKDLSAASDQNVMQQKRSMCQDISKRQDFLAHHLGSLTAERATYERAYVNQVKQVCSCQNRACIVDALVRQKASDKTCRVSASTYSLQFKKVGERRWVSNNGPEGLCAVVSVQTLEHEEKYDNLWTYTESTVVGNTEPEFCRKLSSQWQKPEVFSWRIGSGLSTTCDAVVLSGSHIGPK